MKNLADTLSDLHVQLLELMRHPEANSQDKASVVRAGTALAEIQERHKSRAVRASRVRGFAPVPGLDPGWMLRRERAEEAPNA